MIKQIELFDSISAQAALDDAQKRFEDLVPVQWGEPILDTRQLAALDYLNHQKDRVAFIEAQEKILSDAISNDWHVIACYSMGDGMKGCRLILYKQETEQDPPVALPGDRYIIGGFFND